jgi:transposase InsO family protein
VEYWSGRTGIPVTLLTSRLGISRSKYYEWTERYGKVNNHNGKIPRDWWLLSEERQAILDFQAQHPFEGYRRLTYMMMDADVVAVSATTVFRVLKSEGRLGRSNNRASLKGKGFCQPVKPHEHWHVDVSYLNIGGTFYYLCCVLDGCSRSIVAWDIKPSMKSDDIQLVIQKALDAHPGVNPRIISDNGPQFVAIEFRKFVRFCGMTHVRTSPYYPQSNGKIERFHKSLKVEAIRPLVPLNLNDATRIVGQYVHTYNNERLHSALSYVTPADVLAGRKEEILVTREKKLTAARQARAQRRTLLIAQQSPSTHDPLPVV